MIRIILIVAAVLAVFLMLKHVSRLSSEKRRAFNKKLIWAGVIGFVFYLAITGRLHFIAAIVAGILPFARRLVPLIRYVPLLRRLYRQVTRGSRMTTSLLVMSLDAESGDLDGEVKEGPYQGKKLSELTMEQLLHIHKVACDAYPDSVQVLEAYLDRQHNGEWRQHAQSDAKTKSQTTGAMSLKDAYAILGLNDSATKEEVIQAHRKLMQKLHPDRGGSDFLAAQVNQAKEMILEERANEG